jgi:hypothetical protein
MENAQRGVMSLNNQEDHETFFNVNFSVTLLGFFVVR